MMKIIRQWLLLLSLLSLLSCAQLRRQDGPPDHMESLNFEEFEKKLDVYRLYRGQTRILFRIADLHLNNEITEQEYQHFQTMFETPFSQCDASGDHQLDAGELEKCLTGDSDEHQMKNMHLLPEDIPVLFHLLNKPADVVTLDLGDYVFLRKVNYVFTKCTTNAILAKADLPCGL